MVRTSQTLLSKATMTRIAFRMRRYSITLGEHCQKTSLIPEPQRQTNIIIFQVRSAFKRKRPGTGKK